MRQPTQPLSVHGVSAARGAGLLGGNGGPLAPLTPLVTPAQPNHLPGLATRGLNATCLVNIVYGVKQLARYLSC